MKNKIKMNLLYRLLLFTLLVPLNSELLAQSHEIYSLEEAVRIALENNPQIRNGELSIKSSSYQTKELKSALLPKMDFNAQYLYYMKVPSQYAPASAFGGPDGQYNRLTLTLPQTTSAGIQSTVNLFNKSVFTGLKAAHVAEEASEVQLTLSKEDLIYNVTATYFTIQILQDNLERLEANINNLQQTVSINESLRNNELVSDNVHNRLLINLENLRNQFESQRLSKENNLSLLKYLMNVGITDSLAIQSFNYNEMLVQPEEYGVSQRSDLKLQQLQIKLSKYEVKSAVAGYYPILVGNMAFSYAGYNHEFAPTKQLNNDWITSQSFSLNLKIPLFDGFQKQYSIKQKQLAVEQNINTLTLMKANAEREIADARGKYISNANQLLNNKKSLDLAEQLFSTSQREFETGLINTTDLLNAQNDLSNARTNYSTALLNLKLAELGLKKATGSLLENSIEN